MAASSAHIEPWGAARRSVGDWVLGGLGVTSALVSASFAAYMVAIGPAPRSAAPGAGAFPVFANFDRRPRDVPPADAAIAPPPPPATTRTAGPAASDIDFTPTGSIDPVRKTSSALPGGGPPGPAPARTLPGYAVHDVFDGKAVVEAHNRLTIVEPGSTIDGAGPVLAIRRQGSGWVVETSGGLIGQ